MNPNCIFCKIVSKEITAKIVFENKTTLAFYDIHPKSPIHILIIPKEHVESISSNGSENIVSNLIKTAKQIAKDEKLEGYKLLFNVGKKAGQTIEHLHLHLLSAKNNQQIPSQLTI